MRIAAIVAAALLLAAPAEAKSRYMLATTLANSGVTRIFVDRFLSEMRAKAPAVAFETLLDGRLGGETDLVDMLKAGEHDLHLGTLHSTIYYPELDATLVPYLFPDFGSIERFLDGPVGRRMADALARKGNAVPIGVYYQGKRWTTSAKRFETVEELHDIKIRMPEIPLWIKVWGGMGAAVTPIAATEVHGAVLSGAVDAQENTLSNILGRKTYEGQRYLIDTAHQQGYVAVLAYKPFWQKLPAERRRQIEAAVERASDAATDAAGIENGAIVDELLAAGLTLVHPKPEFRQKAMPVIEKAARETLAPGIYEAALVAIGAR